MLFGHKSQYILLDTSSLIDGRINAIYATGFMPGKLAVTTSVINELHMLADGSNSHKKSRAKKGMSVLAELQKEAHVLIFYDDSTASLGVDDSLLAVALKNKFAIMTTDVGLEETAQAQGVRVLNPNRLAGALRPLFLPGEEITLKIIQKGERSRQGVGYLEDGTMVVVQNAGSKQSQELTAIVDKYIQSDTGKMIFAHLRDR